MGVADFLESKISGSLNFEPTKGQVELFRSLAQFVTNREESDIMVVSGYAGTGKTSAIGAFVRTLKEFGYKYVLLAPTGRSAKVLSSFTGEPAFTIHKHIYRQKSLAGGLGQFTLNFNKARDTFYIVDEASLVTIDSAGSQFGSGDLLEDLISFMRGPSCSSGNALILIGDNAQLPPVGMNVSPALDEHYMSQYGTVEFSYLTEVVRQERESGILHNATILRSMITSMDESLPKFHLKGFDDIKRITGGDLIESLTDACDHYGSDDVVVLCRSNKRASIYNAGIRGQVLYREERLNRGDKLMVVKNCYQFMEKLEDEDFFIANGDVAELMKISHYEERYGLNFAGARFRFPDYENLEITARIILDTLTSDSPSLSQDQLKALFEGVYADYYHIGDKRKRMAAVREDPFFNAMQIKYAAAITCHKAQGGQWPCVFIDNPFWQDEISAEDLKWLYTAMTRATDKIFLVNFKDSFFE